MKNNLPTKREWKESGFDVSDDLCSDSSDVSAFDSAHGNEGQNRQNYTDEQDRESYAVTASPAVEAVQPVKPELDEEPFEILRWSTDTDGKIIVDIQGVLAQ